MIKETYRAVKKKVVSQGDVVLVISRSGRKKHHVSPLAPSRELLNDWKQDRIVWKEYVEEYYQQLRANKEASSLSRMRATLTNIRKHS